MNVKRIKLYIENIENVLEMMKLELEKEEEPSEPKENTVISLSEFLQKPLSELSDTEVDYYEEPDDGANVLLNSKEESDFYSNFRLGK